MDGDGCNREIYMNTCAIGAMLALLLHSRRRRWWLIVLGGTALGLGSALKPILAVHWLLFLPWLLLLEWRSEGPGSRPKRVAIAATLFALGPALIWVAHGVYFAATGRWLAFAQAVFAYNVGYTQSGDAGLISRFWHFFGTRPAANPLAAWEYRWPFRSAWALWLSGAAGFAFVGWRRPQLPAALLRLALVAAYLEVCLPGLFWRHYYYLMLPGLVMLTALLADRLVAAPPDTAWAGGRASAGRWIAAALVVGTVVGVLDGQRRWYFGFSPDDLSGLRFGSQNLRSRDRGRQVAAAVGPDDYVYQYGSDVGIYYYGGRRCASRFTMAYPFEDKASGYEENRRTLIRELLEKRPRLVLVSQEPFRELSELLRTRYRLVQTVSKTSGAPDVVVFEDPAKPTRQPDWRLEYEHLGRLIAQVLRP
jgi:hypothetical protein